MTKLFLIISICLCVLGCASYAKKNNFENTEDISTINNPYFSNPEKDYVYRANIEVYDKTYGGIFIVKKTSETDHRVVFTTELGNKLFDFSYNKDEFKVNYILEVLDKKVLINILKRDFKALIANHISVEETYKKGLEIIQKTEIDAKVHYYFYESAALQKIVRTNNGKEKVVFLFSAIADDNAKEIEIKHSNIKLNINLTSIN